MSEEADNLVLRHLRELRNDLPERLDRVDERQIKTELHLGDLRGLVLDARAEIGRQVEELRTETRGARVADRLAAVEGKIADIERRLGT